MNNELIEIIQTQKKTDPSSWRSIAIIVAEPPTGLDWAEPGLEDFCIFP